jgi:hypothetical protein
MLNHQKPPIFTIHKIKKYGDHILFLNQRNKFNGFNKKRLPWFKEVL